MLLCACLMLMVVSDLSFCLDEADLDLKWENWKIMHQKEYGDDEEYWKDTWKKNMRIIDVHNQEAEQGKHSYKLGMHIHGDMRQPKQGFNKSHTCGSVWKSEANYRGAVEHNLKHFGENTNKSLYNMKCSLEGLPKCIDYRERGMVTPVKHQAYCGSCWAFSAVGALEGQLAKSTGQLLDLSPQNLVDCNRENDGCNGGEMMEAFAYVKKHGIKSEKDYPYKAEQQCCRYKSSAFAARCKYFGKIPEGDECALAKALHDVGPLSVAINANHETFWLYQSGVYYNEHCDKNKLDHAMVLVGYGDTAEGEKYWIVKNSFGTTWGEDGYIRVARDRDNHCGIASDASYSII